MAKKSRTFISIKAVPSMSIAENMTITNVRDCWYNMEPNIKGLHNGIKVQFPACFFKEITNDLK